MSAISLHASLTLAAQGGGYQPQRKDNFAVVISGVQEVEKLVLSTSSVDIPGLEIGQGKIKHFNETTYYAAARSPTTGAKIKYYDFVDRDVLRILAAWYKQVYCPVTGAIGWAGQYKKSGEIYLLPPGMPSASCPGIVNAAPYNNRTFVLRGVWPRVLKYDPLDMQDDGTTPAMIELELSCDNAIPEAMLGSNGGSGGAII